MSLAKQRALQINSFGVDPADLEGEELAAFVMWNMVALQDEIHEALHEVPGWKPWSTKETPMMSLPTVERDMYLAELVDADHFLKNLFLVAGCTDGEREELYDKKCQINADRQAEGYAR